MLLVLKIRAHVHGLVVLEVCAGRRGMEERSNARTVNREGEICGCIRAGHRVRQRVVDVYGGPVETHSDRAWLRVPRVVCGVVPCPIENLGGVEVYEAGRTCGSLVPCSWG